MPILIQSLELRNFLCHSHLKLTFTNRLTLIGGLNGSGKSAIMIAIGVVLGQRAFNLDRGNSNKSLIKTRETSSVIILTLNNYDNFIPSFFFGKEIIIERKITLSSSQLLIYNFKRKLWSRKRSDLNVLLDFYSLRFENPVNFLTQENAKKFLNVSDFKVLYEFFLRGTELEDMKSLHEETERKALEMSNRIESMEGELKALKGELKMKKSKVDALKNVDKWKEDLERLRLELKWAQLDTESTKRLREEYECIKMKLNEKEMIKGDIRREIDNLKSKILDEERKNHAKQNEIQEKLNSIREEINNFELEKREIQNDLKEMDELIEKNSKIIEDNARKQENNVDQLAEEIERAKIFLEEKRAQKINYEKEFEEMQNKEVLENEKLSRLNVQISQIKGMIEENRKLRMNQLHFLGESTARMLHEFKRTKFKGKVIGPIAEHIELKDKMWYVPVSIILRNFLNGYIVFEREDKEKLQSLINKYRVNNAIILVPTRKHDRIIEYRKNNNYITVLDVISCNENTILNQLIICAGIEQLILIEDRSKAHKIISSRPQNVDSAFTLAGDQIKLYGNSITDFSRADKNDKYYFESTGEKITGLESKLKELESMNRNSTIKNDLFMRKSAIANIEKVIDIKDRELNNKEIKYRAWLQTQEKIGDDELEKVNQELEMIKGQRNGLYARICEIDREIKKKNDMIMQCKNISSFVDDKGLKQKRVLLEEQFLYATSEISKLSQNFTIKKNHLREKLSQLENEKSNLLSQGKEFKKVRDRKIITDNISTLQAKIEISQKSIDRDQINLEISKLNEDKEQKEKIIEEYKDQIQTIFENALKRSEKREEIKRKEAIRAAKDFKKYTLMREYEGDLKFDHEKQTLEVTMKLKTNIRAGSKSTLSGGERSFAGICMLLSLWPSVCCPVKILDEFDVYMDNLNRKVALQTILEFVKNSEDDNQVILITPLDTDDFFCDLCEVVILESPRGEPATVA